MQKYPWSNVSFKLFQCAIQIYFAIMYIITYSNFQQESLTFSAKIDAMKQALLQHRSVCASGCQSVSQSASQSDLRDA